MAASSGTRAFITRLGPCWCTWFVVIVLAGCLTRQVIPISYVPEGARPSIDRISDYENVAKAIAYVMVEELKLPRIETVLIIYPSLHEFESGLVTELESTPGRAAATTHFLAVANCKHKKVLANGHGLSRLPWSSRVKTLAHEMTHIAQFELAQPHCGSPHVWMTEGLADWAAYKVLDALKIDSFASGKKTFLDRVGAYKSNRTLPPLSEISSSADWEYLVRSLGGEATYGQAFLAVDFLVERKGLPAAVDYFKRFGRSNNRQSNFTTAFGEDVSLFEREFSAHLLKLLA